MKIVIDGRMIAWTGIGRYTRELLSHLQGLDQSNQYIVLLRKSDFEAWQPTQPNFTKQLADFKPYSLAEQLRLPGLLRSLHPDLVHFVHFNLPIFYFGRRVVTIHDFTLIQFKTSRGHGLKKLVYELKHLGMRLVFRFALRSSAIITDTVYLKDLIVKRYPRLKAGPIHPIHLGADLPTLSQSTRPVIDPPYLLYVGTYYPHKNIGRLVEAFATISQAKPNLKLCLAGGSLDKYFLAQIKHKVSQAGLDNKVVFPGYIDDRQLTGLYRSADLFVFPSLSEGFGLPPLEAMAYGTPTIVAKATTLPEVCGNASAYFDPTSSVDMAKQMLALLDNPAELDRLRQAGPKQAKKFSWRRTAEQTLKVYKQLG